MRFVFQSKLSSPRHRSGFVATDLFTGVVVAGVVVALLLPAIQQAREAARRSTCKNNLKQIALAMHNYHDTLSTFPAAYYRGKGNDAAERRGWGWGFSILPFIEQENLFDRLEGRTKPFSATGVAGTKTAIEVYRCPSSPGPAINPNFGNHGTSNYAANWGKGTAGPTNNDCSEEIRAGNGLFSANSEIQFRNITDGTTNTFLIGERAFGRKGADGRLYVGAVWAGMPAPGKYHATMAAVHKDPVRRINGPGSTTFSSHHTAGAQFALADGSVRFFSDGINPIIYERLGQRNDGQVVELP